MKKLFIFILKIAIYYGAYYFSELSLFDFLVAVFIFQLVIVAFKRVIFKELYFASILNITSTIVSTMLTHGRIRVGKEVVTITMMHLIIKYWQYEIFFKQMFIKLKFRKFNFTALNNYLNKAKKENFKYEINFVPDHLKNNLTKELYHEHVENKPVYKKTKLYEKSIKLILANYFSESKYEKLAKANYNDFISKKSKLSLLEEYCLLYYVKHIRKNYVISNMPIFDVVTKKFCKVLKHSDIQLMKSKDFVLERYTIMIISELSILFPNYMNSEDATEIKENGLPELMSTYGHVTKENSYLFVTAQRAERPLKVFRELFAANNIMEKRFDIIGKFNKTNLLLISIIFFNRFIQKPFEATRIKYLASVVNLLDFFNGYLYKTLMFFQSMEYIKTRITIQEGDGFKPRKRNLYIPKKYVFGKYNTHAYGSLVDRTRDNAVMTFSEREEFVSMNMTYVEMINMGFKNLIKINALGNQNIDEIMNSLNN